MLDALFTYCSKWQMIVNVNKTQIVIYRKARTEAVLPTGNIFTYAHTKIEIVPQYKYLGIIMHETQQEAALMHHRLNQGKKAMANWIRRVYVWRFKPRMASKLFMTCVLPAFEYGLPIWGASNYRSHEWQKMERFWRKAARYIAGAPTRTSNEAVLGEIGWTSFWTRAAWQAATMWTRVTRMPECALVRKAMCVQRGFVENDVDCWLLQLRDMLLQDCGSCGNRVWNEWWEMANFRLDCERIERASNGKQVVVKWEDDIKAAVLELAQQRWLAEVQRVESRNGAGNNKLRTYAR